MSRLNLSAVLHAVATIATTRRAVRHSMLLLLLAVSQLCPRYLETARADSSQSLSLVDPAAAIVAEPLPAVSPAEGPALSPSGDSLVSLPEGEPLPPPIEHGVVLDDFVVPLDGPIVSLMPNEPPPRDARAPDAPSDIVLFGYNPASSRITWLPGHDNDFGLVSLENLATLDADGPSGVVAGFGVHFLDGPIRTEMPARLYDFTIGYQRREWIRPDFGWDFVFRVGVFSDFEGSAKEGVRFPSHVVSVLRLSPSLTWLLGIDYLDWDDLHLLPVAGAVWTPTDYLRFDLAFPRPRAAVRIMDSPTWIYLAGEPGGSTWAIEREQQFDDNATYRDLRLIFGIETAHGNGSSSALELGYVFDRQLSYGSTVGDYAPDDCLMIAIVSRY